MKTSKLFLAIAAGLFLTFAISSCKKESETFSEVTFNIDFAQHVNNQAVVMDSIQYTNEFGNKFSVSRVQYFISDIVLHRSSGDISFDMAHYIDAKIPSTTSFSKKVTINKEDVFTGVSFVYGLTEKRNVDGAFPNPPINSMEWPLPLGGGYHYMKLEGKHDAAGNIKNFQCHTGPTNGNQYYKEFSIPNSFEVTGDSKNIEIVMNIEKWFASPNILDLNDVTMIMGNETMQSKLEQNAADVFSVNLK